MVSPDEIEQVMEKTMGAKNWSAVKAGKKSVVGSCGSGMTAAVLWLALQTVGASRTAIYDEVRSSVPDFLTRHQRADK